MDIVITIPKSINWDQYLVDLRHAEKRNEVLNFKVPHLPKVNFHDRCYIVHDGAVRGYNHVLGVEQKDFICTTTGKRWKGIFVVRYPKFHPIDPIPMKGFQGFRYWKHDK